MSMQGVGYNPGSVNVGSDYSKQNTKANQNKDEKKNENVKKYAIGALGALALAGGIAIAVHKIRTGKAAKTPKIPITLTCDSPGITSESAFKAVDASTGKKAADSAAIFAKHGMLDASEVAEEIGEQGESISKSKRILTRNLDKSQKKQIKKTMTAARDAGVEKAKQAQETLTRIDTTLDNAASKREQILTQLQNAKTEQEVDTIMDRVEKKVSNRVIVASDTLAQVQSNNPQVVEAAKTLQTKVEQETENAIAFMSEATTKAQEIKGKIAKEAKKKAMQQSNPQIIANQEKEALSRLKSLRSRNKNKTLSESEFLKSVINNSKESEATRKLAQSKLDKLITA